MFEPESEPNPSHAIDGVPSQPDPEFFDDDGRPKRTGNVWTSCSHIITAVIGSGVLSLAWAIAQLGWIAGPVMMILFSLVSMYTSSMLSECYRCGDPIYGQRSYTFVEAVRNILGGYHYTVCGIVQYLYLYGSAIGYTIAENGTFKGTIAGGSTSNESTIDRVWGIFQGLGDIAFAYSFAQILIEIQDTIKNPPSEVKTMKNATKVSVLVTTTFYLLCGCMGYAAFGADAPGNLLTGFSMYNPAWVIDVANAAVVIHLVGAYQVYVQPVFAFLEKAAAKKWPQTKVEHKIPIPGFSHYNLNIFRLIWRTVFVIITTFVAMLIPFFNDVLGFLGAVGFWPLSVFYPVEMYIVQKKIPKWSTKWLLLKSISACRVAANPKGVLLPSYGYGYISIKWRLSLFPTAISSSKLFSLFPSPANMMLVLVKYEHLWCFHACSFNGGGGEPPLLMLFDTPHQNPPSPVCVSVTEVF
ncbi:amino acid permease [Trifolium pratense]|uniref:Amino acid permease n=1 Tax=Trifolium pratense TaxID=57577 RepID=A0A2K3NM30_TRIPR|nr:amino acid permease [Trifolium pratense]